MTLYIVSYRPVSAVNELREVVDTIVMELYAKSLENSI